MRKVIICILALLITGLGKAIAGDAITFVASAPNAVVSGEQFRLTYTANSRDVRDFRIPEIDGFEVLMGPISSTSINYSNINGNATKQTTLTTTYVLLANKEGEYKLPGATAKIEGSNYTSNSLTIKVLPADKASTQAAGNSRGGGSASSGSSSSGNTSVSSSNLFMRAIVSNNNVYEQEPLLVTYKLYSRVDISRLESAKFPEFDGFLAQEITLPDEKQWSLENYNGQNYRTVVLKQTLLFPQRSGKLTLRSGTFDVVARIANQARAQSIFDDFFSSYSEVNKTLSTPQVDINVKPLPSGKPASFSGTVGDLKMNSSLSSKVVKANESITLKIEFSGSGNLKLIKTPEVKFPADFDLYDPKIENNLKTTASSVTGKQTIEYLAIPRHAGDFTIPSVEYSYFDLKSNSYKTLTTPEYSIHVDPGEAGSETTVSSSFTNKEDVKYLGKDIRYIQTGKFEVKKQGEYFFGTFTYWLCYIVPFVLFIIFLFIYRKQAKENANIALMRNKKANKVASKRLKKAANYLKENQKEAFYEETMRALWGYVSDKMNMPLSVLTKDNVGVELTKNGADQAFVNEFMEILNTCEFARYAPSNEEHAMDKLYERTVNVINKMESFIKK
ncbi:MAG: BatD family protein [Bacteroidales bacterium]|nr:BatD family protein [Bacteroidales bacterium]